MTENKYQKQLDRQAVLFDFKNRIIDFMESGFVAPEVGIYDEPVRYLKMNEEWFKIFAGWLAWMESPAFWSEAEDDNYIGIQEILVFEEGIEAMATQEDIAKGMYQAMNWFCLQVVSGNYQNLNIVTDGEGVVTQPTGDATEDLPEDDPLTQINEESSAKMGGAIAVRQGLRVFFDKIDTAYGSTNGTPTNTAAYTQFLINSYFQTNDANMDLAIDDYYTYRMTNNKHQFTPTSAFDYYLYCKGANLQTFTRWILDISGYAIAKQEQMIRLAEALADEFWTDYFAYGMETPSSLYVEAPCTPAAVEEFTLDMSTSNNVQYTTNAVYKAGHRLLMEVSGSFVDSDVPDEIQDYFYAVTISTGAKLFRPVSFAINGAGITEPVQAQVPYQPSHSYAITLDIPTTSSGTIIFGRDNDAFDVPNVTGILTFKITDLGEWVI